MKVTSIDMQRFMSHTETSISLPNTGAVVITGLNGSGKSSFIEAVSYAHYGKTLRGTDPWREGEVGWLRVESSFALARREVTPKGTKSLYWGPPSGTLHDFDTPAKAKAALAESLPLDFELWRRTHVFSASDAAHFSMSTDHERKRFIESVLGIGIDKFDPALEACRAELREAERAEMKSCHKVAALVDELARVRRDLEAAKRNEPQFDEPVPPTEPKHGARPTEADFGALTSIQCLRQQAYALRKEAQPQAFTAERNELARLEAAETVAGARAQLRAEGQCSECGAAYTVADGDAAVSQHRCTRVAAKACAEKLVQLERTEADRVTEVNARIDKLCSEERAAMLKLTDLEGRRDAWASYDATLSGHQNVRAAVKERHDSAHAAWLVVVQQLGARDDEIEDELMDCRGERIEMHHAIDELKQTERVLGMGGVRAAILGDALDAIQQVANSWLARIAPGVSIRMSNTSTTKKGGHSDKIALEVLGAGGGHGYKGSSAGERRRVDSAILLSLAHVASGACGLSEPGTLWLDEVFDALDSDGVPAVGEAIAELAKDRCVVVMTHSPSLAAAIPDARRLHVTDGEVADGIV